MKLQQLIEHKNRIIYVYIVYHLSLGRVYPITSIEKAIVTVTKQDIVKPLFGIPFEVFANKSREIQIKILQTYSDRAIKKSFEALIDGSNTNKPVFIGKITVEDPKLIHSVYNVMIKTDTYLNHLASHITKDYTTGYYDQEIQR